MIRALLKRAMVGLAVVIGVVTLMFFLIRLAPGDPALLLVGPTATQEQLASQRKALGLDRPLAEQYATWLGRFVRG
ncbi:MAG: ABC transporter permease, partial [Gemmatimonadales bacterium]